MNNKESLRARCRQIRDALLPEQVAAASSQVCDHLAAWPAFRQAGVVMTYMAFRGEIDLGRLMDEFPDKRWVLPRVVGGVTPHMILHLYDPARLVRHKFGMLEPDPSLPVVRPDELDLVLTPGLAYDRRGYRLGFGGGFYDRFLPHVAANKIGIVFASLIVEHIPNDHFDQRVDVLASESGICVMADH
jgi:5-formyltetrahydrofolate cyclo-ligase